MSLFDDEFGLFGEETQEEDERRSTLGARKIASGETIIDEIEPEDERPARRPPRERRSAPAEGEPRTADGDRRPRRSVGQRPPIAREIAHPRAAELLEFLAKGLVSKPDAVHVALHPDAKGAVLELEVDPEDLGKVIGRGGRVAQALRTLVRAGAEGRVTIDIIDAEEDELEEGDDDGDAASALLVDDDTDTAKAPEAETKTDDAPATKTRKRSTRRKTNGAAPDAD